MDNIGCPVGYFICIYLKRALSLARWLHKSICMSGPFKSSIQSDGLPALHRKFQPAKQRRLFTPMREFDPNNPELLDRPGMDPALLDHELQTLESFNRRMGGHALALRYVKRFVRAIKPVSLSILDLGTGAADIPRAIAAWARQRGLPVEITAVDGNAKILEIARSSCAAWPEIRFEQHDLRNLQIAENSFDLVVCSLTLHHFDAADAVTVLRNIRAIARRGYFVNDLRRNWPAIWSTELFVRGMVRNEAFGHDAIKSCRAAFTPGELREMAAQAGLTHFKIHRHQVFFRMVLEGRK